MSRDATCDSTHGVNGKPGQFGFRWKYALIVFVLALGFRCVYLIEAAGRPDIQKVAVQGR